MSERVPVRLIPRPTVTESAVGTAPPSQPQSDEKVTITIDGRQVEVNKGRWIIEAAEDAGVYIPRFCYHPRMKPVGMCRMCLVEVIGPRGSSLMPACYNAVADGMEIRTASPMAKKAQEGVLEFLLINHPLDCPVCDKGGECPLQDQTLAYGPGESRFVEEKRHWEKPIAISDLVYLDRERCIQCGRCVRFADEVAGDPLIDFAERGDQTEVATYPGEPYLSYFSGNVVQICPVGALTAKPYRFKARPWDLEQVESTCTTCSVGCRVAAQASSGELTRLIGVDSDPVNWGWLCDKGRFAFAASTSPERITVPLVRRGEELVETSWGEALAVAAEGLAAAKALGGGSSLAVVGGARLANEDAYAWAKAARIALGTDNIDAQLGDGLPATTVLGLPRATIDQAAAAPLVLSIGPDVKDDVPVLYLRLRDAVRENGTRIVELTPAPTGLSPYAAETVTYRPGEIAALAAAVAGSAPVTGEVAGVPPETIDVVRAHISHAREMSTPGAPSVVVIVGRPSLAESEEQVAAAARILAGLPGAAFLSVLRRANVHGALDMGLAPGVLPGRVSLDAGRAWYEHHWRAALPAAPGLDAAGIMEAASRGHIGGLVLLGADPRADFPDALLALKAMLGARFVVAVDTHLTASSGAADVILPAATWAERRGTFTNLEDRITWLSQLVTARGVAWPDWVIASELATRLGVDLGFSSLEEIWDEIARLSPLHHGVPFDSLTGQLARDGWLVPKDRQQARSSRPPRPLDPMADPGISSAELHKVAPTAMLHSVVSTVPEANGAAPEVASTGGPAAPVVAAAHTEESPPELPPLLGLPQLAPLTAAPAADPTALRLVTRHTLWDAGTQVQAVPALAGLHPTPRLLVNPSVLAAFGIADGEPVRVVSRRGALVLPGAGDFALPAGTAVLAWNLPGAPAGELIDSAAPFTEVTIEPVGSKGAVPVGDPLFDNGLNLAVWIILLIKTVAVFAIVMVSVLFMVMYERKAVAWLGVRYGPNRAGPNGWLQSLADGTKLLFKEAFTPRRADKVIYKIAPYLMLLPALVAFAIVPVGGKITVAHHTTELQLADPPWGILFLLMTSGVSVYGVMLAGWASGSKYPLLGSVRASAQLVSYEAVLGLTTTTVVLVSGSLRTSVIVAAQHGGVFLNRWNFLRTLLVPFVLFAIAITAEMTRPPFDLVEAEEELSGGYNMEYSSIDFAWFYLAEYAALVTNSAIIVTLWFGGPDGPRIAGWSIGPAYFVLKLLIVLFVYVWIRATLPRLRYDQLMDLGWKRLIPISLAMLMVVAGRQIDLAWGLVALGASFVLGGVLWRAIDMGRGATAVEAAQHDRVVREGGP